MVYLIALVPAFLVYAVAAASGKKSTLFWAALVGIAVGMMGPPTFLFLDVGAVLGAVVVALLTLDLKGPQEQVAEDAQRVPASWSSMEGASVAARQPATPPPTKAKAPAAPSTPEVRAARHRYNLTLRQKFAAEYPEQDFDAAFHPNPSPAYKGMEPEEITRMELYRLRAVAIHALRNRAR